MTTAADATVAIATRDRPDALARCLDRIWRAERTPGEVVVVDQGADESARAVIQARRSPDRPIRYLRRPPRGLAAAQNAAVRAARSPIVAITDDDCLPEGGWLRTLVAALARSPHIAAVTGRVLPAEPHAAARYAVASRTATRSRTFRGRQAPWHVGSGNNFAVRRDAYLRIGGCDERLGPGSPGRGGVDMDLFYRLLRAGGAIRYEPGAVVRHERRTANQRMRRRPMYGHGLGACCALWLRHGDAYAVRVMGEWLLLRAARVLRPRDLRRHRMLREEIAVLRGTLRGLAYGARAPPE